MEIRLVIIWTNAYIRDSIFILLVDFISWIEGIVNQHDEVINWLKFKQHLIHQVISS